MTGVFAARFLFRSWRLLSDGRRASDKRVVVFGAGEAGRRLLRSMARDPGSGYHAVALLDDDQRKQRLRVEGVQVRGTRDDIARVAQANGATALVVALPQADSTLIRELSDRAAAAGLDTLILPPLREIIGGRPTSRDLRDVNVEDLLGRRPITLDTTAIAEQIAGRAVLVTGAGGSIGSELCRQIARFGPAKLYMLDRDESGLLATQMSITGQGLLQGDEVVLADIRDARGDARGVRRPAGRGLPRGRAQAPSAARGLPARGLEDQRPGHAQRADRSRRGRGRRRSSTSRRTRPPTPPACSATASASPSDSPPTSPHAYPGRYVSVRFGNVLGSRGSVVHTFMAQIQRGGPITVTHPDVRRYFMLIPEACQLVLEAGAIGADGEVMVLEMGEQVRIVDVAKTADPDVRTPRHRHHLHRAPARREALRGPVLGLRGPASARRNRLINSVDVPELDAELVRRLPLPSHGAALEWMRARERLRRSGGSLMTRIHLSKAVATEVEEQYVLDALRSGWVAPLGPQVDAFEGRSPRGWACATPLPCRPGTAALHLALLGLGAGPGTVVVVPTMTFAASAIAVLYTGATPVFVDADGQRQRRPRPDARGDRHPPGRGRDGGRGDVRGPVRPLRGLRRPPAGPRRPAGSPWSRTPPRHSAPPTTAAPQARSARPPRCRSTATRS